MLEQNGPQAAATWRWCSRCCSPSSPPSTAPLTPATVLPAEGTPLVSFERRAAPGGCCYLPPPPLATHPAALGTSLLQQGTCAQTSVVRRPEQPRGRIWAPATCAGSGATDEPRVEGSAQSTGWVCPGCSGRGPGARSSHPRASRCRLADLHQASPEDASRTANCKKMSCVQHPRGARWCRKVMAGGWRAGAG